MLNTIRLKILAVALALLAVFAAASGFSTYLVKQVIEEMQAVTVLGPAPPPSAWDGVWRHTEK